MGQGECRLAQRCSVGSGEVWSGFYVQQNLTGEVWTTMVQILTVTS
jgi:hypothetical protein